MKFINRYQKFMIGRYGYDKLFNLLFAVYIILLIISIFINTYILLILRLLVILIIIYRYLSKNTVRRSKENKIYLKIRNKIKNIFKHETKDKNHIYKKCHHCHKILRLPIPLKKGIKHSICPICKKKNTFIILRKQKIEIIK